MIKLKDKYEHGGLRMVDINSYIKGLKSTWIRRLIKNNNSKWKTLLENSINLEKLLNTGSDYVMQMQESLKNDFWKEVTIACKEIQDNLNVKSWQDYCCHPLWNNNKLKIGNQSFFFINHGMLKE